MKDFTSHDEEIFKRLGISAVVLFGSRALGTARDSSDFDFGVLAHQPSELYNLQIRSNIYDALYDILSRSIGELRNIDIVFLQHAPAELQMHVVKKGNVLYEQTPHIFANFRANIIIEYADFAPLRNVFHRGIASRIK